MIQVVPLSDADFAWLAGGPDSGLGLTLPPGGFEAAPVLDMLRGLAAGLRPSVDPCAWALVEAGEVAGLCSVVAPPTDGAADIGYGVAASRRGRGVAQRGVAGVVAALAGQGFSRVTASTSVDNPASQRVLVAAGFVEVGRRVDVEDGALVLWEKASLSVD